MRKIILLSFLTFTISSFSQETEFKFSKEGFTDYVITAVENKTQSELYKKALDWLAVTYKNPKEALKAQTENDKIRFEGTSKSLIAVNSMGKMPLDAKYQIEVTFKDGKYKFDIIGISTYSAPGQYGAGGWTSLSIQSTESYYNKNNEIKPVYKYYPEIIPTFFNELNKSLKDFLLNGQVSAKKSDW